MYFVHDPKDELPKATTDFINTEDDLYSTSNYKKNLRSFTMANWCGMPPFLNPRRLVNIGFRCIDNRKV